tara:strand:- start:1383 stop:1487 length:105 start_codon:yes stop_codon:yes gene_type:complete
MADIFTLEDLTVKIPSQKENDPTNSEEKKEENNG